MSDYPSQYLLLGEEVSKQLNLILEVDGLPFSFGLNAAYKTIRYGDAGIHYGDPGLLYGGLIRDENVKPWISLDSALTISQRLEPEQGRASIGQMSIVLIDKDGEVSKVVSPGGGYLDEILGRAVTVRIGYNNTSFPSDYFVVFRGIITDVLIQSGRVTLTFGDAGQKRRNTLFRKESTTLTAAILAGDLIIPVASSSGFFLPFRQPDNTYDSSVHCYLQIGDEILEVEQTTAHTETSIVVSSRGARGTTAASHTSGTEVFCSIAFSGNALTLALKLMASGFSGPWIDGISVESVGQITDTSITNATNTICTTINAVDKYGVAIGDWVTISGSSHGNNGTYRITAFGDNFGVPNTILYLDTFLTSEYPPTGVEIAFQSQFNTFPTSCGLEIPSSQVDVAHFVEVKNNYFAGTENTLEFYVTEQQSGKEFIERELFVPIGAYSLTRFGRLSVGYTRPPIPGQRLVYLTASNVVEPVQLTQQRGINTRKFWNEIQYEYDYNYTSGTFEKIIRDVDTESLSLIGLRSTLPIQAKGVITANGGGILADRTTRRLLTRYKRGAIILSLKTMWKTGSTIEAGDVVAVIDEGGLKITNPETGERALGQALFEVTDRTVDVKTGTVSLKLISGVGTALSDRYGTISPASLVQAAGSNTTTVHLKTSYNWAGVEADKWAAYIGMSIQVHNADFSRTGTTVITGFDSADPNAMQVSPALPFNPLENDIVELIPYDTSSATSQALVKLLHAYLDPTVSVTSAPSAGSFNVSAGDISKFVIDAPIVFFDSSFGQISDEGTVTNIVGTQVFYSGALAWIGSGTDKVGLIGFGSADGGGPYRLL